MDFRKTLRSMEVLGWMGVPGATDLIQAVDAGAGRLLCMLYAAEQVCVRARACVCARACMCTVARASLWECVRVHAHVYVCVCVCVLTTILPRAQDTWRDNDDNLARWESAKLTAGDRRVLMTLWLGAAWEKFCSQHKPVRRSPLARGCTVACCYRDARHMTAREGGSSPGGAPRALPARQAMRRFFEKTCCLMTATGEDDNLIQPEAGLHIRARHRPRRACIC